MSQNDPLNGTHYIHRTSYSTQERMAGLFVLVSAALIFSLLIINSKTATLFEEEVSFNAYLRNAQGISTETPVVVSGIDVGRVTDIDITADNRIHITMMVYKKFHGLLRSDAQAEIGKLSLVGRAAINIKAGDPALPVLEEGTTIQVTEPVTLDDIIAKLEPVVVDLDNSVKRVADIIQAVKPEQVGSTLSSLSQVSQDLSNISRQLASGQGSAGMLLYDEGFRQSIEDAVDNLENITQKSNEQIPTILGEAEQLTGNMNKVMVQSDTLVANLNTTVSSVNMQLQQLPQMVDKMQVLMEQTEAILDSLSKTWPIATEEVEREKLLEAQP